MSSFIIIGPSKRDGYPVIDDNTYDFGPAQSAPYPELYMRIRNDVLDNYPSVSDKSFSPAQSKPYPNNMLTTKGNVMEGYPSFGETSFSPAQEPPYPNNMMSNKQNVLSGYPSFGDIGFSPAQSRPYPVDMMSCTEGLINEYPAFYTYGPFSPTMAEPHQREMMSCKEEYIGGYPTYRVAKNFRSFGAFVKSKTNEIEIPYSVLHICDWAFYDSNITSVKINRHCVYYAHSFPPGCHIKPYADRE